MGRQKEQAEMLKVIAQRKQDFLAMERWKAENCKMCPTCSKVMEKTGGCDSMKCGQDFHGGEVQSGCGATFKWSQAPAYVPQTAEHLDKRQVEIRHKPPEDDALALQVWEVRDMSFLRCEACMIGIQGPCFICTGCRMLTLCFSCH